MPGASRAGKLDTVGVAADQLAIGADLLETHRDRGGRLAGGGARRPGQRCTGTNPPDRVRWAPACRSIADVATPAKLEADERKSPHACLTEAGNLFPASERRNWRTTGSCRGSPSSCTSQLLCTWW